jgi:hypothetical protein
LGHSGEGGLPRLSALLGGSRPLCNLFRGALEEFVDQSLIGLGLLGGEAAKLGDYVGAKAPTP